MISDPGRSWSHLPENHHVPVADDFDPQVTQLCLDQLFSHFLDRERGEQTVQEVALQNGWLGGGISFNQPFRRGAVRWSEQIGHKHECPVFRVAPDYSPQRLRLVQVMEEITGQNRVVGFSRQTCFRDKGLRQFDSPGEVGTTAQRLARGLASAKRMTTSAAPQPRSSTVPLGGRSGKISWNSVT